MFWNIHYMILLVLMKEEKLLINVMQIVLFIRMVVYSMSLIRELNLTGKNHLMEYLNPQLISILTGIM